MGHCRSRSHRLDIMISMRSIWNGVMSSPDATMSRRICWGLAMPSSCDSVTSIEIPAKSKDSAMMAILHYDHPKLYVCLKRSCNANTTLD